MTRRSATFALVVVLGACSREAALSEESRAREVFVRDLAEREGLVDAWSLTSRAEIQFEDGFGPVEMTDPVLPFAGWKEQAHACATGPAQAVRWMGARSHIRLRGGTDMRLEVHGRTDIAELLTRPVVTASFDGLELHSELVDELGYFTITATIPHGRLTGWSDLYITVSSVHEPWRDPSGVVGGKLIVARLERVAWIPAGDVDPKAP